MIEPPDPEHPDFAPFWVGCRNDDLRMPSCANGHMFWPPRPLCPHCLAEIAGWQSVPPLGSLFSWTVVHRTRLPGFEERTPYVVGLATLDLPQSVRFVARCNVPQTRLEPGLPLQLRFEPLTATIKLPYWVAADGQAETRA